MKASYSHGYALAQGEAQLMNGVLDLLVEIRPSW